MSKFFKILGILVGVVVLIVVAAIVIVPMVVDPNDFKQPIAEAVKKNTGRDLEIADDIGLSVFPWVALELGGATLSNAPGFGKQPFAQVGKASVRVKLMPLLSKQLEMDTLILDGVSLDLQRNKNGDTNWADLAQGGKADKPDAEASGESMDIGALAIGGVKITNVKVVFDDRQAGQKIALRDLNMEAGALALDADVPVTMAAQINIQQPMVDARFELAASARFQSQQQQILLSELSAKIDAMVHDDGQQASGEKTGSDQTIQLKLSGDSQYGLAEQLLTIAGMNLDIQASGGDLPPKGIDAQLSANVDAGLKQGDLTIKGLKLSAAGLQISGEVTGKNINKAAQFGGHFNLAGFSPRELLKTLGLPAISTADGSVLKRLSLTSNFSATDHSLHLQSLSAQLDDSKLSGDINVKQFKGPSLAATLNIDAIDVDRYLPPSTKADSASDDKATPATQGAQAGAGLPLETMRKLDLNAKLTIGKFKVNKLHMDKVNLVLTSKNGVLKVNPLTASLYQGSIRKLAALDVRGKTPKISSNVNLKGVQIDPLLTDMNGESQIAGAANIQMNVSTMGLDKDSAMKHLNGTMSFKFLDGAYKGVNIAYQIRRAQALLKRKPAPKEEAKQTDFTAMSGTAKIRNGVLDNRDFAMSTPLLRVKGAGTADLPKQSTDYGLKVSVVSTSKGQGGAGLEDLSGITIPVRIQGSFSDPKVGVDLRDALAEVAKAKVTKKVKAKVEDKIQKKLGDKLGGGLLKGLFK